MSLNCKPGELARVIDSPEARLCQLVDKIVRVTHTFVSRFGHVMWRFEGGMIPTPFGHADGIADCLLRPIRPGESPEESTEAMRRLHDTSVPAKNKEPVVRPFEWEAL